MATNHDGDIDGHLQSLGGALRRLRTQRGLSLNELAARTGLSSSFLSLVENGRSDISTGRLLRVAGGLEVGLGDLLELDPPKGPMVVRAGARRSIDVPAEGLHMYPLGDDHADGRISPVFSVIEVGGLVSDLPERAGEDEFVFVLRGRFEATLRDGQVLLLEAGDSVYYGSEHPVRVRNAGDEPLEVLWVGGGGPQAPPRA
jgi:transcriptional regulator with XRE-family HTH domain